MKGVWAIIGESVGLPPAACKRRAAASERALERTLVRITERLAWRRYNRTGVRGAPVPLMTQNIFPQNVIAPIWDFDKTLTPEYMQKPLFAHCGVDGAHTAMWITNAVDGIAHKIVQERKRALDARLGRRPRHFIGPLTKPALIMHNRPTDRHRIRFG